MAKKIVYLSGLNGLRAIAALSVVIGHVTSYTFTPFNFNLPMVNVGNHGVTLFFVISGFLITYLLLLELEETNVINVKKFYLRRILRIWPIYYLVILICLIVAIFDENIADIFSTKLFFYIFFAANIPLILHTAVRILIHFWSIGVEEQFYLFWPLIVKIGRNRLKIFTIILICVLFLVKSGSWFFIGNESIIYKTLSITRFHCMLIGAVGAMLYKEKNRLFIDIVTNSLVQILAWLSMVILTFNLIELPTPLAAEIIAIISLVLIIGQIEPNSSKILNLENRFLDFLGKISYGLYVIHPLVILLFSHLYRKMNLSIILQTIIVYSSVIIITVIVAYISYEYYEKPFLKFKTRFMVVRSSNSKFIKD